MEKKKKNMIIGGAIALAAVLAVVIGLAVTTPYAVTADGEKVKEAFNVTIEGKDVALVASQEDGEKLIDNIKNYYVEDKDNLESVTVKQKLEVVPAKLPRSIKNHPQIDDIDKKLTKIMTGTDKPTTYKVKEGDTAWDLAGKLDIPFEDLDKWNQDKDLDYLQIGDELNTYEPKPMVDVTTKEKISYTVKIKRKVQVIKTANLYKGEKKVEKKGRDGKKRIKAVVTKKNGIETGRKITSKKVIKEPVTRVVYKGTAERPGVIYTDNGTVDNASYGGGSGSGSSVVAYARQFIGNPYVWGGSSLTHGADCSGFTMAVYQHFGYSLPHNSWAQLSSGRSVSYSQAQPGDLIIYGNHVAIYAGGGQIIHASSPSTGIKTGTATYRHIVGVRRIIN